jgi:hypothetical protein
MGEGKREIKACSACGSPSTCLVNFCHIALREPAVREAVATERAQLRALLAPAVALREQANFREVRTGREDMQSFDAYTGEPFTNLYADDPNGKVHLGERLPETVATAFGAENKPRAALIAALVNALPALAALLAEERP